MTTCLNCPKDMQNQCRTVFGLTQKPPCHNCLTEQKIASIKYQIKMVLENVGCLGNKDPGSDNYQEKMANHIIQLFTSGN